MSDSNMVIRMLAANAFQIQEMLWLTQNDDPTLEPLIEEIRKYVEEKNGYIESFLSHPFV
jgi:hypothetical protein